MSKSELVDLTMHLHHHIDKAALLSDDGDSDRAIWIPLSQIEIEPTSKPGEVIVTMPRWMEKERGLI